MFGCLCRWRFQVYMFTCFMKIRYLQCLCNIILQWSFYTDLFFLSFCFYCYWICKKKTENKSELNWFWDVDIIIKTDFTLLPAMASVCEVKNKCLMSLVKWLHPISMKKKLLGDCYSNNKHIISSPLSKSLTEFCWLAGLILNEAVMINSLPIIRLLLWQHVDRNVFLANVFEAPVIIITPRLNWKALHVS